MTTGARRRFRAPSLGTGIASLLLVTATASANEADVTDATAACRGELCTFTVTIRHADEGWEHYANRFEIVDASGRVLATRVLRHPHVNEQPFTRRLAGVRLPSGLSRVTIRAADSVHALGGAEVEVELPDRTAD